MALYHFCTKLLSRSNRNTVRSIAYRAGCKLYDAKTGQTFNYEGKPVQHVELLLPKDAPSWALEVQELMLDDRGKGVQAFVEIAEAAEKRCDARVWREFEFSLHRELTEEQNITLAREFVVDQICSRGMAAQLNFHFDVNEATGEEKPHCHITVLTRRLIDGSLSPKKEIEWDKKALLLELREQWAIYSNFHLKLCGHDIQIDHRSYKERGIEIEPQPKRGRGIIEQEKRIQKLEGSDQLSFVTDKAKAFYDVQLRNLYRILRNPEIVFEIVTKHHSTFMWPDIQKKLHQYIDDPSLFNRVEAKLKASPELLTLRYDPENKDSTIYTTRQMLRAEKSLIETAEGLGKIKSHGVNKIQIENAIIKAHEELKEYGGLSSDQKKAIYHLTDKGQIKCVVGIAGAGKTTALGICHKIWKAQGYGVYGLAPTGKASQNLEDSSLDNNRFPSMTLHKFLKSYEEGRCHYNERSVLVLDEAGMVDVERFEKLLGAVKELGVKLIVVGDGAQLQPVEAGPAFRLVTTRLGKAELNTVLRQKEDWQKEATLLFGQQRTNEAIQRYGERGNIHIVDEKLPSLDNAESALKLFEISHRVSSLIYREIAKDIKEGNPQTLNLSSLIKTHQDYERYVNWNDHERKAAQFILKNIEASRPILEKQGLDPLRIAQTLSDKRLPKNIQQREAINFLKEHKLEHLIGQKPSGIRADVRKQAKEELIHAWHKALKKDPNKSVLILAYNNRDVQDLNQAARSLLKTSGHISGKEVTYTIKKEVEDDFGRTHVLNKRKSFSKGDRIVFTKNNYGLGVRNGTMGTIIELSPQKIRVKLDGENGSSGNELSYAPNLYPYFDHGWALTIHKSQGTTVDRTFLLASFEMTQNLAYVAMTRHREDLKVFGSSLDFWRPEKLPQVLSKSGEKLFAGDYLDAEALIQLMKKDDLLITKIFNRIANELEAMGAVTKQAFWTVADHFLNKTREKEIRIFPESIREEVRAEELFGKPKRDLVSHLHHEHLYPDFYHLSRQHDSQTVSNTIPKEHRDFQKEVQQQANATSFSFNQIEDKEIQKKTLWQAIRSSLKGQKEEDDPSYKSASAPIISGKVSSSLLHTSEATEKEINNHSNITKEHYLTDEFKKAILGERLYQKLTASKITHKAPQTISEELKREIIGDRFYNRSHKKRDSANPDEISELARRNKLYHIEEDHAHHDLDISISQKPPSRGRKR